MDKIVSSPEIIGAIIGGIFLLLTTLIGGWFNVRAAQIRAETERAARMPRTRPRQGGQPIVRPEQKELKRPLPIWLLSIGAVLGVALLLVGLALSRILPIFPSTAAATLTPTPTEVLLSSDTPEPTADASVPPGFPGNRVKANSQWIKPIIHQFGEIEMVLVPAGCFTIGSEGDDANDNERHGNRICFNQPFWINRTEVTNAQYDSEGSASGGTFPRDIVLWREATAFCDSWGARLPTEAEWEYAARGPDNLLYPWGDVLSNSRAIYRDSSDNHLWPVGSKPEGASWVGAVDMSGNTWEWTSSLDKPYPYEFTDGRESPSALGDRIIRGGSYEVYDVRASHRYGRAEAQYVSVGFRCARNWSPSDPLQ